MKPPCHPRWLSCIPFGFVSFFSKTADRLAAAAAARRKARKVKRYVACVCFEPTKQAALSLCSSRLCSSSLRICQI
ncbi:hypothetical protein Y032_0284g1342 [Ancylostoma ceylanicum]|uniref:Uncharacterized protein n=1 Tax=Ancylostoma ceylanicum TaxID=53326 RepID=A0A016S6T0_9BILA|nr:hypothetical protein Y032_0284g1342 [Ancylostoma ceylanicum]